MLTINDFSANLYKGKKEGFKNYLDSVFSAINGSEINNLIIDLRKNEGGSQGMEDILLAHLITDEYTKYSYVVIPSFEYSFLEMTDYKNEKDILKKELSEYFIMGNDGRYVNKPDRYQGLSPNPIHFDGNVYVLISGLTFSGGSEFAALAKNYTKAIFLGEETGGGYYGNTSGNFLRFTLPNTQLTGRIPLCKYVVNTQNNTIPFGHGLLPDEKFTESIDDVLAHNDSLLDYTVSLIKGK